MQMHATSFGLSFEMFWLDVENLQIESPWDISITHCIMDLLQMNVMTLDQNGSSL